MFKRVRCRIEKCVKFLNLYKSQEPEVLYDSEKAYRATNEMISHIVTIVTGLQWDWRSIDNF